MTRDPSEIALPQYAIDAAVVVFSHYFSFTHGLGCGEEYQTAKRRAVEAAIWEYLKVAQFDQPSHAWDFSMIPGLDVDKLFPTCARCSKPIWSDVHFTDWLKNPTPVHPRHICSPFGRAPASGAADGGSNPPRATSEDKPPTLDDFIYENRLTWKFRKALSGERPFTFEIPSLRLWQGTHFAPIMGYGRSAAEARADLARQIAGRWLQTDGGDIIVTPSVFAEMLMPPGKAVPSGSRVNVLSAGDSAAVLSELRAIRTMVNEIANVQRQRSQP